MIIVKDGLIGSIGVLAANKVDITLQELKLQGIKIRDGVSSLDIHGLNDSQST